MSSTYIEANYGARVDVIPSAPSAFCLSVTEERGTYANVFLTHAQAAQVAAALTVQEPEPEWNPGDLALDRDGRAWHADDYVGWYALDGGYIPDTETLTDAYGPLRRAKIVEASS